MIFKNIYLYDYPENEMLSIKLLKQYDNGLHIIQTLVSTNYFQYRNFDPKLNLDYSELFKLQKIQKDIMLRHLKNLSELFDIPFNKNLNSLALEHQVAQKNAELIKNKQLDINNEKNKMKIERLDFLSNLSAQRNKSRNKFINIHSKYYLTNNYLNLEWQIYCEQVFGKNTYHPESKRPRALSQISGDLFAKEIFIMNQNIDANDLLQLNILQNNNLAIDFLPRENINQKDVINLRKLNSIPFLDQNGKNHCYIGLDNDDKFVKIIVHNQDLPIKWKNMQEKMVVVNDADSDNHAIYTTECNIKDFVKNRKQLKLGL